MDIAHIERLFAQAGLGISGVFEIFPDMVFVVDRDEHVMYLNSVAARALGRTSEEVVGHAQRELFHPDLAQRHSAAIQKVFATGEIVISENQQDLHVRPVWIDTRLVPFRDPHGEIVAVVGIVRDVTERHNQQEAIALREAYLRSMLDNFPHLVWFKDVRGRYQIVNQAFARSLSKTSPADIVGLDDFALYPRELAERYVAGDQEVLATRQQKLLEEPVQDRGESRWHETFKSPVIDANGNVIGTTGLAVDITNRRQLFEEQRHSREQLRALAAHVESVREKERVRISREIHDELGQSLTCMGMDLAFLDKQIEPKNKEAADRLAGLVQLVKDTIRCVRRISSELRPSILDDLGLGAAIEWLAHDFENRTQVPCTIEVPEDLVLPPDKATTLFRVCQEAMTNITRHATATAASIRFEASNNTLYVRVQDNGRGITDDEIHRPGSLGLLGMKERVALLGGTLEIKGVPECGTTLIMTIPLESS